MRLFHPQLQSPVRQPCCPGCGLNLGERMASAIFCPQCGRRLQEPESIGSRIARAGLDALHQLGIGRTHRTPQPAGDAGPRSPMVLGYGNALYTLGWRYERGHGPFANKPEAVRCYRKSAKLGNLDATMRLAVISNPPTPVPAPPVPLPALPPVPGELVTAGGQDAIHEIIERPKMPDGAESDA